MNISYYLHDEQDPKLLESQLLWLGKKFKFVSWHDVYAHYTGVTKLKDSCHITIDDGWLSTYTVVLPVLEKLGIPASVFVSPHMVEEEDNFWYYDIKEFNQTEFKEMLVREDLFSAQVVRYPLDLILKELPIDLVRSLIAQYSEEKKLEKKRGFLNLEELRGLNSSTLIEVGAHTMLHPILSNETTSRSRQEIEDSITRLSVLLDQSVEVFAYPNGLYKTDFGQREIDVVKSTGVKLAFSVDPGVFDVTQENEIYMIPRVGSINRLRMGRLGLMLPSFHDQVKPRKQIRDLKKR